MLYGSYAFDYHRPEINDQLLMPNIALISTRQTKEDFSAFVTSKPAGQHKLATPYDGSYLSPLYIYASAESKHTEQIRLMNQRDTIETRRPNLSQEFISATKKQLRLSFAERGGEMENTFGPSDVLQYVYAALYSQSYRSSYDRFLKTDFPRIPPTTDRELFAALGQKGGELISLHLMESPKLANFITKYEQPGDHLVDKILYAEANPKAGIKAGRVYTNGAQYFDGVPKEVWEFQIGGYQVCEKWLKDRKGRKLSSDDIDHYQKIVVALNETIRLMREIDEIIPGWPLP